MHKLILILVLLGCAYPLRQARAVETAAVLPKGIFRARVVGIVTSDINQIYNGDGLLQSTTAGLNRSITVQDFVAKEPKLGQLVNMLNSLQAGLGNSLLNSNIYADMTTHVSTVMPALEYGLTEKWSLGIRAPLVHRTVTSHFRVDSTNNSAAINSQLGALSTDVTAGLYDISSKQFNSQFFYNSLFTQQGYTPSDFDKAELGDIEYGGKYNFYKDDFWLSSVQIGMRAPTGTTPSLTNPYDQGTGGGEWAVGAQEFEEYRAGKIFSFGTMAKVVYPFQSTRAMAVPNSPIDPLPSLNPQDGQVQNVTKQSGMEFDGELSSTAHFMRNSVSVWSAYQFFTKGPDQYSGPGNLYYSGLSQNSDTVKHAAEIGAGYSTIPAFLAKQFEVPLEIQLVYNTTLGGRNIPLVSYGRMDMIVYF